MTNPVATHTHTPGDLATTLEFLKRLRSELRTLRHARVWKDHLHIIDINKDYFEVQGVGYGDPEIVPLLRNLNAAFDPEAIHKEVAAEYKEFNLGKCYPWAYDRVM
jgi:hypothetical protein